MLSKTIMILTFIISDQSYEQILAIYQVWAYKNNFILCSMI